MLETQVYHKIQGKMKELWRGVKVKGESKKKKKAS